MVNFSAFSPLAAIFVRFKLLANANHENRKKFECLPSRKHVMFFIVSERGHFQMRNLVFW